jgi:hypothetical protein
MKKPALLHPFLLSAYPVLALMANNLGEIPLSSAMRSLAISISLGVLFLFISYLVLKDWLKAGLIASLAIILFFSYGHIYAMVKTITVGVFVVGRHRLLMPMFIILLGAWIWWVTKKLETASNLSLFFNVVAAAAIVIPVYKIAAYQIESNKMSLPFSTSTDMAFAFELPSMEENRPDVYYIILDGYARADVLSEFYQYDNSEFLEWLTNHGFYVADCATSNYNQTVLSLSSSLNMEYINQFSDVLGVEPTDRRQLVNMLMDSRVREAFEIIGYSSVAFATGYSQTEIRDADLYMQPQGNVLQSSWSALRFNKFEGLLLETSAAKMLLDMRVLSQGVFREAVLEPEYRAHRERVLYTLTKLPQIAEMDGDYFVFAHIIAPHPPFVFGPNGEIIPQGGIYSLADEGGKGDSLSRYIEGYRDQLIYINKLVMWSIEEILSNSDTPPIILIQGDHGSGAHIVWDSVAESDMKERMSILSIYYFADGKFGRLYPSISPVNSFRVVLDEYFGASYELLEDRNYFATWDNPLDLIDVTEQVKTD